MSCIPPDSMRYLYQNLFFLAYELDLRIVLHSHQLFVLNKHSTSGASVVLFHFTNQTLTVKGMSGIIFDDDTKFRDEDEDFILRLS